MTAVTEPATLRSPEKVLSTIADIAEVDGLTAPRRISFDEATPTTPLAVLSLTWLSLDAMLPWLAFFAAGDVHPYERGDGTAHYTAYADYFGWSLSLNALDSARCDCGAERVHMIGCGSIGYPVDGPIPYVPVAMPTGDRANSDECARLNSNACGKTFDACCSSGDTWTCVEPAGHEGCHSGSPVEPVLAAHAQRSVHFVAPGVHLRRDIASDDDTFTAETIAHRHEPAHIVDVVTVAQDLPDDGRGDPGMAHLLPVLATPDQRIAYVGDALTVDPDLHDARIGVPIYLTSDQTSFGQAVDRLEAAREAKMAQLVEALLSEVPE